MRKQTGMLLSFLFLGAMTLVGFGCSSGNRSEIAPDYSFEQNSEQNFDQNWADTSGQPSAEPYASEFQEPYAMQGNEHPSFENQCAPACPPPCAPQGRPTCEKPCPPSCPPQGRPVCERPCAPCPPACPPEPFCKRLEPCKHPSSNQLCCQDYIIVRARNPQMCLLGDQYPLDFEIQACDDICDATVTTHLPEGVSFVRSEPQAQVEGRKLTWHFDSMDKGQRKCARVWLKCECEGELCACFCATATPVRFCALLCAKPILSCEKCGPEQVCPGDPVHYTISVSNRGSCAAEDVVVTDNIPSELEHSSGLRTLNFKLGSLEPCQTKTVNVCLTAIKRGKVCNTAVVTACNADSTSCQWCTCVCCCDVDLVKTGPKELPIGKNAEYQIVATNTGDLPLTDVVITDVAPNSTSIVSANGAQINGNQAVWRLREMKPGEKVTFNIVLTTCTPGCFTNRVSLTDCQGCNACADVSTHWRGRPALTFCVREGENPICIGERTTYTVDITNQGSESDSNVQLVVRFPNEIAPVSASGDSASNVSGGTVTFEPFPNLRPRQTITYRIEGEARASGDARISAEVHSDSIKTPIVQQESTIVN